LRVEGADGAPDFIALRVEENKSWREFKTIHGDKFPANRFLNVQADKVNLFADADLAIEFLFEPVDDRLNLGACNSEGGLKFEQDGRTCANEGLHLFGVVHQWRLAWMQNNPGGNQRSDDDAKGEKIAPFWLVRQQHVASGDG
jgi:hypothetical protein